MNLIHKISTEAALVKLLSQPPGASELTHLPTGQDGRHFVNNIFKRIFLKDISIKILLKSIPRVPIDNEPAMVQVMAWCRTGDKPLPEPMLTQFAEWFP